MKDLNKIYGQDSSDVVYIEDIDMFISVSIGDRLNEGSFVCLFESKDGIKFDYAERICHMHIVLVFLKI